MIGFEPAVQRLNTNRALLHLNPQKVLNIFLSVGPIAHARTPSPLILGVLDLKPFWIGFFVLAS